MALQGPSGSGKTYSSLQIAYGLCSDWSKIAVVDTENSSADLYANFRTYNILGLYVPILISKPLRVKQLFLLVCINAKDLPPR